MGKPLSQGDKRLPATMAFYAELEGKNGCGDPWHTDGRLAIVLLRSSGQPSDAAESDSFGGR